MTIASIDVGSNSVLLLIAKVNPDEKSIIASKTYYETPRISEGVSLTGFISSKRQNLLFNVLDRYNDLISEHNVEKVLVTATKAFRVAKNAELITSLIYDRYGWNANIISGEDEARLTFLGTAYPLNDENQQHGVIDIGGGSTEIVIGTKNNFSFKKSFNIGVVSITEQFLHSNPPTKTELTDAGNYIDEVLTEIANQSKETIKFNAVAGTPTTLACIQNGTRIFVEELIDDTSLLLNDIRKIKDDLASKDSKKIMEDYGKVVDGREDVLLAGTLILERILLKLQIDRITVSTKGLRFGVVYDFLKWL